MGNRRIVFAEDHPVIEFRIDPEAEGPLDVAEIDQHPPLVERFPLEHDHGFAVMAVEMPALSCVVEQSVPVAKIDLLRNSIHGERPWEEARGLRGSRRKDRQSASKKRILGRHARRNRGRGETLAPYQRGP